jgi:hypothetical protein
VEVPVATVRVDDVDEVSWSLRSDVLDTVGLPLALARTLSIELLELGFRMTVGIEELFSVLCGVALGDSFVVGLGVWVGSGSGVFPLVE